MFYQEKMYNMSQTCQEYGVTHYTVITHYNLVIYNVIFNTICNKFSY